MTTFYVNYDSGNDFPSRVMGQRAAWNQNTYQLCKGIWRKRRRMVNGKRRTAWFLTGLPTDSEYSQMRAALKDGNAFGLRKLTDQIEKRFKDKK